MGDLPKELRDVLSRAIPRRVSERQSMILECMAIKNNLPEFAGTGVYRDEIIVMLWRKYGMLIKTDACIRDINSLMARGKVKKIGRGSFALEDLGNGE